jgi:hypothetical protein
MIEADKLWLRKTDQKWEPPHPDPEGLYSDIHINKSLEAMHSEAVQIGLRKGVAFVVVWPFFSATPRVAFTIVQTISRESDPDKEGDSGTNYFGIAMSKLAYMLSTREDSGSKVREIRNGEVSYRGGLTVTTQEGTSIYAGYSGGTEDQDVQIAIKGLNTIIQLAEEE